MSVHIYTPLPKGITHVLFDADDTLYPSTSGMQTEQLRGLILSLFWEKYREREGPGASKEKSRELAFWYYQTHGSAYVGMVREFGMNMDDIVDYIYHSDLLDYSALKPCAPTRSGLETLRFEHMLRLAILSNGTDVHVHQVLQAMNLTGLFGVVHGLNHNDYVPKPHPAPIENTLWEMNARPDQVVFVEDSLSNLKTGQKLGMGYSVFIAEGQESPPENPDGVIDLWANTLPEALDAINEQLAAEQKTA